MPLKVVEGREEEKPLDKIVGSTIFFISIQLAVEIPTTLICHIYFFILLYSPVHSPGLYLQSYCPVKS